MQIALVNPLASSTLECVTAPDVNVPLFLLQEDDEHEARSICGGDTLSVTVTRDTAPVVLDCESVSLEFGEVAMVPVACKSGLRDEAHIAMVTNVGFLVRLMTGHLDGNTGMAMIVNSNQPSVLLERGGIVGALRVVEPSAASVTPVIGHVAIDEEELAELLEVDMPPEAYYDE